VFDTVQGCIYNIYKASFSPGSVQQIMPYLLVAYTTMTAYQCLYIALLWTEIRNVQPFIPRSESTISSYT
jgi:hypothetical protein